MKIKKAALFLLISIFCWQHAFAQEEKKEERAAATPKADLKDEFEAISCEDLLNRLDGFFASLQNDPTSQGYAVISGRQSEMRKKLTYELLINGHARSRKFPDQRVMIVRGAEAGDLKVQFWQIPAGAATPNFNEARWDFAFAPSMQPFIFHSTGSDAICPYAGHEKIYAEYLEANPNARGHLVIYGRSVKDYKKIRAEIVKSLPESLIPRLRFYRAKNRDSGVEYWIVPASNK